METLPMFTKAGLDAAEPAVPLLPDPLYQGLCTWFQYPQRLHLYREQVEPLLLDTLDGNPWQSQQYILEVLLHGYRMAYFEQESQYAFLDGETVSVEEQRLRDAMDARAPEEAVFASEEAEQDDPIQVLYRRYGPPYTRKLLGLDQHPHVSPEYLACCYQQQYHRAKAFEAYTGFLRCATRDEAEYAEVVWLLLERLSQ